MKNIFLALISVVCIQAASAQKSLLGQNEQNKYIYYQVVERPGVLRDSLGNNAVAFVKENFPKIKSRAGSDTSITIKDNFQTYSVLAFAKHESGEIRFTFAIEYRNFKYRYWLTDFVFVPYERNRYGVYVPVNGIEIPLEKASAKLDKKELEGYLDQTGTYCEQLGARLKAYMLEDHRSNPKPKSQTQPVKKVVTDKW
jgi:hypothetical protein